MQEMQTCIRDNMRLRLQNLETKEPDSQTKRKDTRTRLSGTTTQHTEERKETSVAQYDIQATPFINSTADRTKIPRLQPQPTDYSGRIRYTND